MPLFGRPNGRSMRLAPWGCSGSRWKRPRSTRSPPPRGSRVLCLAHVTNTMGLSGEDFEKGEANGAHDALQVLGALAASLQARAPEAARGEGHWPAK
jgi:hypothetical protein